MNFAKILQSQAATSTIAICLLISSYIFTVAYNLSTDKFGEISAIARICLFLTIAFLCLFLLGFMAFMVSVFRLSDFNEIFMNPSKVSTISVILLFCSYLSTVMNGFTGKMFGELSSVSQIFFYLGIVFIVLFVVAFMAMLVSLSNKFLYSRKL
ncbi:MAG: hypothetical protein V1886_02220 [archaeon]